MLRRTLAGSPPGGAEEEFLQARETQNFVFPDIAAHVQAGLGRAV